MMKSIEEEIVSAKVKLQLTNRSIERAERTKRDLESQNASQLRAIAAYESNLPDIGFSLPHEHTVPAASLSSFTEYATANGVRSPHHTRTFSTSTQSKGYITAPPDPKTTYGSLPRTPGPSISAQKWHETSSHNEPQALLKPVATMPPSNSARLLAWLHATTDTDPAMEDDHLQDSFSSIDLEPGPSAITSVTSVNIRSSTPAAGPSKPATRPAITSSPSHAPTHRPAHRPIIPLDIVAQRPRLNPVLGLRRAHAMASRARGAPALPSLVPGDWDRAAANAEVGLRLTLSVEGERGELFEIPVQPEDLAPVLWQKLKGVGWGDERVRAAVEHFVARPMIHIEYMEDRR
ncbi:hypothetical protein BU23DRAFT_601311 [Bimuria novae-zelandiae CBS 107.79]|uniref:Uncharacterized protein n=1 Tax=Bimuria novae-zelandiae CBS 107.79 TaxID=1447943 RepID=A0A6A5V4G5_9PLEO|nr:hypothetical protein BU23DRAFT_601311 [Bimuria novae-zelandiae CBS 107.79]